MIDREPEFCIAVAAELYDEHSDNFVRETHTYTLSSDVTIDSLVEVFKKISKALTYTEGTWYKGLQTHLDNRE